MRYLFRSYDVSVESAYVIAIRGNETSESLARRCVESCHAVGMPVQTWDAFDGTRPGDIVIPSHSAECSYMSILKVMDNYLTKAEVALALSHISLWLRCARVDRPIVILEHDAVMVKRFERFRGYNTIVYLGCTEWAREGWAIHDIPLHGSDGPNKHFILRGHAYAIDPAVAKNMLAQTLKMGIYAPLDEMIYADLYNISHDGLYAYDAAGPSTVVNRPTEGRTTRKNDDLSF